MANSTQTRSVSWATSPSLSSRRWGCLWGAIFTLILLILSVISFFFFSRNRTNILILGLDSRETNSDLGRSDTIILTTFVLRDPYLGMLSIPRDLWVTIPGYGENRINTAHFFAEADFTGSGPPIAIQTVNQNFGIKVNYYIRIRFDGFLDLIDLIGGIDVDIPKPMSGYTEGTHHMSSEQALAFVRDRDNSDDFYRMQRTQIILVAILRRMSNPAIWRQATDIMPQLLDIVDTDIPLSQFINLTITLLRVGWDDIDSRVITREYTHPFTTPGGAQVLEPDWNEIKPLISEMFGEE